MGCDLAVKLVTEDHGVLEVFRQRVLVSMPVIPDPCFPQEVETRSLDHFRCSLDAIRTEEDGGTENALEGFDEPSVFFPSLAHAEGIEHLGTRTESNRLTLLLDGQRGQIDRTQPILSIRQAELGMPCALQQKVPVPPL